MRKNTLFIFTLLLFLQISISNCQQNPNKSKPSSDNNFFYVANYNVENLFDTIDDDGKIDEWFTPESEINWTEKKLRQKLENLSDVIEWMNNGLGPDLLGIEEVEHKSLLEQLLDKISLKKNYKIVHYESPDKRGIDNAIIYNADLFKLLKSETIEVILPGDKTTRDILYANFLIGNEEIHFYVNHWPSRREGLKKSEPNRIAAANALIKHINSLDNPGTSNIIIIGDFNDLPSNISISQVLEAKDINCDYSDNDFTLFNLTSDEFKKGNGTYKYRDHWNMLDQIIVSNFLVNKSQIDYYCNSFEILKPEFILQTEGKYKGTSLPTFGGRKYLGGYSDHFAIGALFKY